MSVRARAATRLASAAAAVALGAILLVSPGASMGTAAELPQAPPNVNIVAPTNGEVVTDPAVMIRWTSSGLEVVAAALATRQEQAHFHVFVDTAPDLTVTEPWGAEAIHTGEYELRLDNLGPGTHTVWVAAGFMDHTP